jgi:hypothetical protein
MKTMPLTIISIRTAVIAGLMSAGTAEGLIELLITDYNQEVAYAI